MTLRALGFVLFLVLVLSSSACIGSGSSVNAYGGLRALGSDDLDGVDDQTVYGIDGVLKLEAPFLGVEGGWLHSEDDTDSAGALSDVELGLDEYFVGLRLTPWDFFVEPYGAVGVSLVDGDLEAEDAGSTEVGGSDTTFGYYVRVGAAVHFGILRIGLDGRAGFSDDVDLEAIETDTNYTQLTLFAGLAF